MNLPIKYKEFWIEGKHSTSISREDISRTASELGFCLYRGDLYRIIGKLIYPSTERDFQDELKYCIDPEHPEYTKICNIYEAFMQKNTKYMISRLQIITRNHFLNDASNSCYKFFKSGYIKIMADKIFYREYKNFPKNKYVLSTKVQPREYKIALNGKYSEFLSLATDWANRSENIMSIIGYLCHEYKDETTGYIIVLTEQCPDPKDGGGSGKNLFCNLLSYSTTYHSKNGSQVKFDEKFFQSWNQQRIMSISDAPKNFKFDFLKEPSTGTFILKKLYKDEIEIPVQDGPKFVVQTNFSYEVSDGGLKRRIIPIEFTDFFTKAGGIDVYFKCHFPTGWSKEDWCNYDTIIAASIQQWLASGRKLSPTTLTESGWMKQFEYTYRSHIVEFITDNFNLWVSNVKTTSKDIQDSLTKFYDAKDVAKTHRATSQRVYQAIKEYAKHNGLKCETNKTMRLDNESDSTAKFLLITQ